MVSLRPVTEEDLPVFFEHQTDAVALRMAAFPTRSRVAFMEHWHRVVLRPENVSRTIVVGGVTAGYLSSWAADGKRFLAYWLGREHWGKGIATRALSEYLGVETARPLSAWVAAHNAASIRVLEKCGFRLVSRQNEVGYDEVVMTLAAP